MKYLYIVLDGAGDREYKELKNQSPLEYAKTPFLDKLASVSKLGRVNVIDSKIAPESDAAVMSLLGYDVKTTDYPGRGVIESIGAGWKIRKDSIYFRANFATVNEDWDVLDSRAGRIGPELAKKLVKALSKIRIKGARIEVKHTAGHRAVVRVTGKNLSDNVTGNNNFYKEIPKTRLYNAVQITLPVKLKSFKPRDKSIEAKNTALLMELYVKLAYDVLSNHPINKNRKLPANMLILRGPGSSAHKIKTMKQKTGLDWAGLVEMPVEEGICKLTSMKSVFVGSEKDSVKEKAAKYYKAALKALKKNTAVYIHIKGPDLPSHDGDLREKVRVFEEIDSAFFKPLLKNIRLKNTSIIVTADHSTECASRAHTALPTPLLLYKPGQKTDGMKKFSEKNCKKGSIGLIKGKEIIQLF
ncbi:MAG: 2,3-bisphosphoglycerate-independent phosphoglycerate mutase [Nanoarchaeota archaeon]|nr:2,3-bisphosphoglycerate-independent phosphoglycerate mutase [Nanoarchaeota archaeon]